MYTLWRFLAAVCIHHVYFGAPLLAFYYNLHLPIKRKRYLSNLPPWWDTNRARFIGYGGLGFQFTILVRFSWVAIIT